MRESNKKKIVFVMGVSGSGKSTIGQLLARELTLPFIDADDYHSKSNVSKMSNGISLTDEDRKPWLQAVNKLAKQHRASGCVIACSALKEDYRSQLSVSLESNADWIYLKGDFEAIFHRMQSRLDHFMGADMLKSQFETLEEPKNAFMVDISESPENIIEKLKTLLA